MFYKNYFLKPALFVFLVFTLSACTITEPSTWPIIGDFLVEDPDIDEPTEAVVTDEPITLTYWGLFIPEEAMRPLIDGYTARNPNVTINYEEQTPTSVAEYKERLATRLAEGTGPDIFRAHNTWFAYMNNLMSPLPTNVMGEEEYAQRFYNVALQSSRIGGNLFGIPLQHDQLVLIYNRDFFAEAGIITPPETWEDFRSNAISLTKRDTTGAITQAGAGIGTIDNVHYSTDIIGYMLSQSDVVVPDFLDDPAAESVVSYYTALSQSDEVWSSALPSTPEAFANGRVAIIFGTTKTLNDIYSINPNINLGVANAPQVPTLDGTDNLTDTYWANFWMESVSYNAANATAAWDFLRYASEDQQQAELRSTLRLYFPVASPYGNRNLNANITEDTLIPFITGANRATSGLIASCAGNLAYRDALGNVIRGTSSLSNAKTDIENLLIDGDIGVIGMPENCPLVLGAAAVDDFPVVDDTIVEEEEEVVVDDFGALPGTAPICTSLSATPSSGFAPLSVSFNATVENEMMAQGYSVEYGDGQTGTLASTQFTHTYNTEGTYTVVFTPVSETAGTQSCSAVVTVSQTLVVDEEATTAVDIEAGVSSIYIYVLAIGMILVAAGLLMR